MKSLSQITLEIVNSMNTLKRAQDRLVEITVDGEIGESEYADFANIKEQLSQISLTIDALHLWFEKMVADGKIDATRFEKLTTSDTHS